MSEIYGNTHYPHARRIYSRPYPCYFQHLYAPAQKEEAVVRDRLHDIGKDLLGGAFRMCCDMDYRDGDRPRYFSTPFWNERDLIDYADAAKRVRRDLPPEAAAALGRIVKQLTGEGNVRVEDVPGDKDTFIRTRDYDVAALTRDFKTLWEADIMLDPRLTHAEELFYYAADGIAGNRRFSSEYYNDAPRLAATLEWMRKPENAGRIAQMFLYSRLAQHFSETDPQSFIFAQKVAADLNAGRAADVIASLRNAPDQYYTGQAKKRRTLMELFGISGRHETVVMNAESLAETAERIVDDYTRLRDGSWAGQQLGQVRANAPGLLPQPRP